MGFKVASMVATLFEGTGLLLHIHAAVREDIAEFVLEDVDNWDAFFLRSVTGTEQFSDPEPEK